MKSRGKKVGLVALSAVMVGSIGLSFTGCSGGGTLTAYIFCGENDKATYQSLVDTWANAYTEQLKAEDPEKFGEDFKVTVNLTSETDTTKYFDTLNRRLIAGNAADIIYVSPSSVQRYVANGYALDLTNYLDFEAYSFDELWGGALGRYSYNSTDNTIGQPVEYVAGEDGARGAFYQLGADGNVDTSKKVGVYALPKDYSSFSYAYNANFFDPAFTNAYENTADTHGAVWEYGSTPAAGTLPTTDNATPSDGIIKIGETVTYYPFNFYKYMDLDSAYKGGDPVAVASVKNGGYDITMPGYPNDTWISGADDPDTQYDDSLVHMVYTYAEFSAMSFAVSYYITAYDSNRTDSNSNGKVDAADYPAVANRYTRATWLNGTDIHGAYGNDQYDSATYYLSGWLYGNDNATIIKDDYSTLKNPDTSGDWGMNTDKFMETYAAFLAYSSDWAANMFYAGQNTLDTTITNRGGWEGFVAGYSVFYGYGTWDTTTMDKDKSVLDYQVMATPVSEDNALYSRVKDKNYESKTYNESNVSADSTFTDEEIKANMIERQDKWGARTDSVGFGVNADVVDRYTGENAWRVEAAASLCAYLTVDTVTQVSLTYAGSQIPNYATQGYRYLHQTGEFESITTPGSENWDEYYEIALEMTKAGSSADDPTYVSEWLTLQGYTYKLSINPLQAQLTLGDVKDSLNRAFRVLNMASHNYTSRNLLVRMAELNNVSDPCTYTYDGTWWGSTFSPYEGYYLLAYNLKDGNFSDAEFSYDAITGNLVADASAKFTTPYNYVTKLIDIGEGYLQQSIQNGKDAMQG